MKLPAYFFEPFITWKAHADGRIVAVEPLTFGRARINVYRGWSILEGW